MAEIQGPTRPFAFAGGDARELQARLYREIGLLAVAAALNVRIDRGAQAPAAEKPASPAPAREKRAA